MLFKLALVAASVLFASLVARRFGHAVGGTVAGLPMIAGPIMGFLVWQESVATVEAVALATLTCLPATAVHLWVFAWCAQRWHWARSWCTANLAVLAAGLVAPLWSPGLPGAVALATGSLLVAHRAMPHHPLRAEAVEIPKIELALRVIAAVVLAWVIVRGAGVVPAALSGLLLAIPITGNVLPCFTLPRHGVTATVALLAGFLRGLLGFLAFFATLAATLAPWGRTPAYLAAWGAALLVAASLYALSRRSPATPAKVDAS
jgi:hypothetical protein